MKHNMQDIREAAKLCGDIIKIAYDVDKIMWKLETTYSKGNLPRVDVAVWDKDFNREDYHFFDLPDWERIINETGLRKYPDGAWVVRVRADEMVNFDGCTTDDVLMVKRCINVPWCFGEYDGEKGLYLDEFGSDEITEVFRDVKKAVLDFQVGTPQYKPGDWVMWDGTNGKGVRIVNDPQIVQLRQLGVGCDFRVSDRLWGIKANAIIRLAVKTDFVRKAPSGERVLLCEVGYNSSGDGRVCVKSTSGDFQILGYKYPSEKAIISILTDAGYPICPESVHKGDRDLPSAKETENEQ